MARHHTPSRAGRMKIQKREETIDEMGFPMRGVVKSREVRMSSCLDKRTDPCSSRRGRTTPQGPGTSHADHGGRAHRCLIRVLAECL